MARHVSEEQAREEARDERTRAKAVASLIGRLGQDLKIVARPTKRLGLGLPGPVLDNCHRNHHCV